MAAIDKRCPECGKTMTIVFVDRRNPETDELEGGVAWMCLAEKGEKRHIVDITDEEVSVLNGERQVQR
jgi:hypothetical protein